jgi:hypothetical protein
MNATKRTQEIAHRCPHPFEGVDMNLTDAISVVIARPLVRAVIDLGVGADDMVVALPFVSVHLGMELGVRMDMVMQSLFVGVMHHPQAHLSALASHRTDNGRPVVVVSAMPPPFVGPSPRRIVGIEVRFTFFPPRSETSRPFQSAGLVGDSAVASARRWPGSLFASREPFGGSPQSPERWPPPVRLCISRAATEPLALAESTSTQTRSHCIDCRCLGNRYTDTPLPGFSWSCGTHVPPPHSFRNVGISTRRDGSTSAATTYSGHHPVGLQLESPC